MNNPTPNARFSAHSNQWGPRANQGKLGASTINPHEVSRQFLRPPKKVWHFFSWRCWWASFLEFRFFFSISGLKNVQSTQSDSTLSSSNLGGGHLFRALRGYVFSILVFEADKCIGNSPGILPGVPKENLTDSADSCSILDAQKSQSSFAIGSWMAPWKSDCYLDTSFDKCECAKQEVKQAKCGRISKAPGGPKLHSRKQINNHFRNPKLVNAAKVPRKTSLNDTSKKHCIICIIPKRYIKGLAQEIHVKTKNPRMNTLKS